MIIECSKCKTKNKILPSPRKGGLYRCHNCKEIIHNSEENSSSNHSLHEKQVLSLHSIIEKIHNALDGELKFIQRHGATSRITLFSGKRSSNELGRIHLYRFEMLIQRNLPEGSRGTLIFGKRSTDAKVIATEGQFIWLDLSQDFGDRIPHAFYDVAFSFLLKENPDQIKRPGLDLMLGTIQDTPGSAFSTSHSLI